MRERNAKQKEYKHRQIFVCAVLVSIAVVSVARAQTRKTELADCPVTIPRKTPDFVKNSLGTQHAYWNGALYCASLWPDATVPIGPKGAGAILPDSALEMKYVELSKTPDRVRTKI